jgi:hypothetical protein
MELRICRSLWAMTNGVGCNLINSTLQQGERTVKKRKVMLLVQEARIYIKYLQAATLEG